MAEKPPEESYISVVDEEPELLQLLQLQKWDAPQIQKQHEPSCEEPVRPKTPVKRSSKAQEVDPFSLLEPDFIKTYMLSKDLARSLCDELKPVMPDSPKSVMFSVECKVLAALAFFASGKYQKSIAGKTDPGVTQYFVSTAVTQVTEALNHPTIVKKYIHFPHLKEERDIIKARFYMKYGVPNVLGCVECTHVPIARPEVDHKAHFNKSYHSKKVQIICDSDLTVISVEPCPGAQSHDGILSRHAVRVDLESLNHSGEQCWLIGGPYYTLKPYLMTAIPKVTKKTAVGPEKYYNVTHKNCHTAVTLAIKHLKSRWKCLQATCNKQFDPTLVSMMIVACCILHNMCNKRGLPVWFTQAEERLEVMKQKVANGPLSKKLNDDQNGLQARSQLVERLWNERRVAPENNDGPKKRTKKDCPRVESQTQVPIEQLQGQSQVEVHQLQGQSHHMQDDPSKRPRMLMNPPTYGLMQPVWTHYPTHH